MTGSPPPAVIRTAESRADVIAMATELVATDACESVRGRFLPLLQLPLVGPPRGDEPVDGRWWVQTCTPELRNGQVELNLSGVGWQYVNRAGDGLLQSNFRVIGYVHFAATGTVVATVDMSFDPIRHLAWLQFRPTTVPVHRAWLTSQTKPVGNWLGKMMNLLDEERVDADANQTVVGQANDALFNGLNAGFALTYDLRTHQRDLIAGGRVPPQHPLGDSIPWLINEREILRAAGGFHVNGPFASTQGAGVDFFV